MGTSQWRKVRISYGGLHIAMEWGSLIRDVIVPWSGDQLWGTLQCHRVGISYGDFTMPWSKLWGTSKCHRVGISYGGLRCALEWGSVKGTSQCHRVGISYGGLHSCVEWGSAMGDFTMS